MTNFRIMLGMIKESVQSQEGGFKNWRRVLLLQYGAGHGEA
jgi:hypothetical protein